MKEGTFEWVQANKVACIPATERVEELVSQLPAEVKFISLFGFSNIENPVYAAFSIPTSMTKNEFHKMIGMDCSSFILEKTGVKKW